MISEQPQGAVLRLGKVVKVHPSDHSVDVVLMDNGAKMANVQLIAPTASTRSGRVDLPEPELPDPENPWSLKMSDKQDLLAVIAMMAGTPLCLGFLYPQVNELAMPEDTKNLAIDRHASDFLHTIDDSANVAFAHPGGSYLTFGAGISHLDGKDFDQKWKTQRNKTTITITIHTPSTPNGEDGSTIKCAPTLISLKTIGNIIAEANENISADAGGDITANAGNDITIHAGGSISITAGGPVTVTGSVITLN